MNLAGADWCDETLAEVLLDAGLDALEIRRVVRAVAKVASRHRDLIPDGGRGVTMWRLARMFHGVHGTPVFNVADLDLPDETARAVVSALASWRAGKTWDSGLSHPSLFPHRFTTLGFHGVPPVRKPRDLFKSRTQSVKP